MSIRRCARIHLAGATLLALCAALMPRIGTTEVINCPVPLVVGQIPTPAPDSFVVTRPGTQNVDLRYRDLEFMVDLAYGTSETVNLKNTMDRFSRSLVDSVGANPFGINASHFRLIYDYFRRQGNFYNSSDPTDVVSVKLADPDIEGASTYSNADRSHADVYIYPASRSNLGGAYPSRWVDDNEDRSTGNDLQPKTANSIMLQGPPVSEFLDTQGTGWTRPRSVYATRFNHELQHSFPGQGLNTTQSFVETEMFSAGAEAIGGARDSTAQASDVPYTWSLIAEYSEASGLRKSSTNYQARSQFMAYLGYNFRGRDTSTTLLSIHDDLLKQWSRKTPTRSLTDLQSLLGDDSCKTCSTKTYFRPGGVPLAKRDRLPLLLHNWRVANYVNNSLLDEGQFGYPPGFGFSPAKQTGAWVNNDGVPADDAVAIPPVVTLTSRFTTRDTVMDGWRSLDTGSFPLVVQPIGAEYWVVTSDPGLWQAGQELRVRVSTPSFNFLRVSTTCGNSNFDEFARLMVSIVTYREPWNASDPLWKHPEWAFRTYPAKAVFSDSVRGVIEFAVPAFGDSVKAVVIVLTAADGGPGVKWAKATGLAYEELFRYQVQLGVIRGTPPLASPTVVLAGTGAVNDQPAWSPRGDSLVYVEQDSSDPRTIVYARALAGVQQVAPLSSSSLSQRHPDWSPRGDWIAFAQTSPAPYGICEDLFLFNRSTSELRNVSSPAGVYGRDIRSTFSPNGQRVAYVIHELPDFGGTDRWMLRHRDLTGQTDTLLVLRPGGGALLGPLRWEPDGRWIYFTANDTLYAVGAIGPERGKVVLRSDLVKSIKSFDLAVNSQQIVTEETGGFSWTETCNTGPPDFEFLTLTHPIPFHRIALYDTLNRDTVVTSYRTGGEYYNPRLSPDGTRIAYSTNQDNANDRDLWIEPISWNRPPVFSPVPRDSVLELGPGPTSFTLDLNATDSDGESPTFAGLYLPTGATFNAASGVFSWPSLSAGQTHYVVFRALDQSAGVDQRVIKYTTQAAIPPAAAADFNAEFVTTNAITFTWTAPGDDGTVGTAAAYEIRFSSSNITEGNWANAIYFSGGPVPQPAGEFEQFEATGLPSCTWRYWAIKTRDEAGNWSPLSAVVHVKTLCGGGGGLAAGRVGGRGEATGGSLASGSVLPPQAGRVLSLTMQRTNALPVWSIQFLTESEGTARLARDSSGVLVERRGENGTWVRAGRIAKLPSGGFGLRLGTGTGRRYLLLDNCNISSAASAVAIESGEVSAVVELTAAQHSRFGNVAPTDSDEAASLSVAPGDTVGLAYQTATDTSKVGEGWALMLTRATSSNSAIGSRTEGAQAPPVAFALHQSEPNPFARTTTIRFDLPRGERVKLVVLDLQGRQVATLADAEFAAGRHAVAWNGRSRDGSTLPAGIYFYRLQAGAFRAQKRMTLLP